jgi:hypothetical protein
MTELYKRQLESANQARWLEKSEPLRNKLALIIMGDSLPRLEKDDYLPVSHLFTGEHEHDGAMFLMLCMDYNTVLFGYGVESLPLAQVADPSREPDQSKLTDIAEQIMDLLNKHI